MKIAFVHMTMGLTDRGSEVVVDQLASSLSKRHDVMVIQSGNTTKKSYTVKRVMPIDMSPVGSPKNIFEKLLFRLHLDRESGMVVDFTRTALPVLSQFNPDIIIAVNGPLQVRILQGQALQAKIVAFGHAGIGYHDRDTLRAKPDLFVALTWAAFEWANKLKNSKTKVVYIPNPISRGGAELHIRPCDLPRPIILCVGALSKYKNIDKVIDAIRLTNVSLLLIGDGEDSEAIQSALSTLPNDFRWIRHVEPVDMPSYFASVDAFCFVPDPQESFGLVYLEAMNAGLPVVASYDPIRRKLIGEQGIFVDPHNASNIAMGINSAVQLDRIDYSKELKEYELNNVVKQIEKEFHDLIK